MKKEDLELFKNKRIKLVLKNDFNYSGVIEYLGETSLRFMDKFQQLHIFSYDVIASVNELNGGGM